MAAGGSTTPAAAVSRATRTQQLRRKYRSCSLRPPIIGHDEGASDATSTGFEVRPPSSDEPSCFRVFRWSDRDASLRFVRRERVTDVELLDPHRPSWRPLQHDGYQPPSSIGTDLAGHLSSASREEQDQAGGHLSPGSRRTSDISASCVVGIAFSALVSAEAAGYRRTCVGSASKALVSASC